MMLANVTAEKKSEMGNIVTDKVKSHLLGRMVVSYWIMKPYAWRQIVNEFQA